MHIELPVLPSLDQVADWCRETAAEERVQPWAVEKDFFLTRVIWALTQLRADTALLKGGTCLSKVDLGYHRMSEDIDLVVPGEPTKYRSSNSRLVDPVVRALVRTEDMIGIKVAGFAGTRYESGAHATWIVFYRSAFLPPESAVITVEAAIRPVLIDTRRAQLHQLLPARLANGYGEAFCWALDFSEVRAEKVRAAFTREIPEIRDFYDLELLAASGTDMTSGRFTELVDKKLIEVGAMPLSQQPPSFGLTESQIKALEASLPRLMSVLRAGSSPFDVRSTLSRYNYLWNKDSDEPRVATPS